MAGLVILMINLNSNIEIHKSSNTKTYTKKYKYLNSNIEIHKFLE